MNPCKITEDLLPLYVDNSLNDDSREFVEQHLQECESCRKLHTAMTKTVHIMLNKQNPKRSFRSFRRKLFWKRFPTILLCSVASLIILTTILYTPITNFLNADRTAPMAPVQIELSKLSDGSIYMALGYDNSLHIHTYRHYIDPYEPDVLYVSPKYTLMWQIETFWHNIIALGSVKNWNSPHPYVFTTNESVDLYRAEPEEGVRLYADENPGIHGPFTKVILRGSDGERIIWQEGDELPAADVRSENDAVFWQERIESYFSATLPPDYPYTPTPSPSATPCPAPSSSNIPSASPEPTASLSITETP